MKRTVVASLGAVLLSVAMMSPAQAVVGLAIPGSETIGFVPPVMVAPAGQSGTFVNADPVSYFHNLWSTAHFSGTVPSYAKWCTPFAKNTCPKFWSDTVAGGSVTPILGIERLTPGQYEFYCSLHGTMSGTLIVR